MCTQTGITPNVNGIVYTGYQMRTVNITVSNNFHNYLSGTTQYVDYVGFSSDTLLV